MPEQHGRGPPMASRCRRPPTVAVVGYSPFESALAVLPVGVVIISSQIAGRLMSPAAYKPLMAASLLLIGTGVTLWAGTPENGRPPRWRGCHSTSTESLVRSM
ncbi:hypothetical protein ACIQU6_31095 [Streptomyces sp. NPDC090442]|uniref:hypothetical protein n=1 Tax=Streptomyces sp. NPDC090442 TaxID=3365962 RepID=UPI0037FE38D1